jgi:hypothetical protein
MFGNAPREGIEVRERTRTEDRRPGTRPTGDRCSGTHPDRGQMFGTRSHRASRFANLLAEGILAICKDGLL